MIEAEQPAGKWHYGQWVEPDSPVTGVISARDCSWLCELLFYEGIDLDFIEYEAQGGNPRHNGGAIMTDEYEDWTTCMLIGRLYSVEEELRNRGCTFEVMNNSLIVKEAKHGKSN